jgi:hypothetical protein
MTDTKITALPAFVSPLAPADIMPVVQNVSTTPETRKMTYDELVQEVPSLRERQQIYSLKTQALTLLGTKRSRQPYPLARKSMTLQA